MVQKLDAATVACAAYNKRHGGSGTSSGLEQTV